MKLRQILPADSGAAAALHRECFPDPWPDHAFSALLDTGAAGFALLGDADLTGLILYRIAADEAEILTFAVHPAARRQGLGLRLLAQVFATLQPSGVTRLLLEVAEDNAPALSLYLQAGFLTVGHRSGYYAGGLAPIDALIMARQISNEPAHAHVERGSP